jgi:phosphopentomutase
MINHTPAPDLNERRVIVVVLDGAGVGALPDADKYGDQGSNTLGNVWSKQGPLKLPNLFALGLGHLINAGNDTNQEHSPFDAAYYGRMAPMSPGKDTTSGHWELAGVVMENAFPVYPDGFPGYIIDAFKKAIGRGTLGNIAASGTVIIEDLGEEHLKTGFPIVYTSADSVFQIAAHVDIVAPELLYKWCEVARKILTGQHAVGRVIARPFEGEVGSFKRTAGRHDYSLSPPGETILDLAKNAGYPVAVIGKVADVFAHRGITVHLPGGNNEAIASDLHQLIDEVKSGLIWATFGDFDTVYGHRNDSEGFARALERFDLELAALLAKLGADDLFFITADHGCDPTFPTTDHTREYVPLLAWGPILPKAVSIGTRKSYADLAACAAHWLQISPPLHGSSFL